MIRFGVVAAIFLLAGCGGGKEPLENEGGNATRTTALDRACASEQTYERLKELAFDEAARIRGDEATALDQIAGSSVVRMENPVVRERDPELNVTTCSGRFILELPPGTENAFDGERRLSADIQYAAQTAADGSGLVYQMEGAEPILYRLATVGGLTRAQAERVTLPTPSGPPGAPRQVVTKTEPTQVAQAAPQSAPAPAPAPRAKAEPAPSRPAAAPEQPAPAAASARPSFNCRHARSRSERLVCASGSLASLDRRMSSMFYSALADSDNATRAALRRSRDRFLAFRERCGDEACVAQAYRDRMDEITDMARGR